MHSRFSILLALMVVGVASIGYAAVGHYQSGSKNEDGSKGKYELRATVEGELQAREGSRNDAATRLVLKVSKAVTDDGHELSELRGQTLNLIDSTKGKELFKKHGEGDRLILRGGLYLGEKVLMVKAFKNAQSEGSGSKN